MIARHHSLHGSLSPGHRAAVVTLQSLSVGAILAVVQIVGAVPARAGGSSVEQSPPVIGTGLCSQAFIEYFAVQCFSPDQITLVAREVHHLVLDPRPVARAFSSLPLTQISIGRMGTIGHSGNHPFYVSFLFGHPPFSSTQWVEPQEPKPKYITVDEEFQHLPGNYRLLTDNYGPWEFSANASPPNLSIIVTSNTTERVVKGIGLALVGPVRGR